MDAWIIISIAAAAFQTLRFMLQKTLSMGRLAAGGATFARFVYSSPLALFFAWAVLTWHDASWPALSGWFWAYVLIGGLTQILATLFVVMLFAQRNFAVGITFKKTEVIQTVIVGLLVLGDRMSLTGLAAIVIGLMGVLILSDAPGTAARGWRRLTNRAAGLGLLSGTFFAISAVAYRGATLEIDSDTALIRSATTLSMVTFSQTLAMAAWLRRYEPGELTRVWAARRTCAWMGVASMAGSLSWFTAFTLQNAAYVFAVGQVEVIFSMMAAVLFFKERITGREYWGISLLTASILALVVLG